MSADYSQPTPSQMLFRSIALGEIDELARLLDTDPQLVHSRHTDPAQRMATPLQFSDNRRHQPRRF